MPTSDNRHWINAWLLFVRTHTRIWDTVEQQMRLEHGLTMARYDVLAQLEMAGGRLGLSELGAAIVLTPSGLSKLLDRMHSAGLIRREPDPNDARAAYATITPQGRKLVNNARKGHHAHLQQTF